jgi:hypothetical protein
MEGEAEDFQTWNELEFSIAKLQNHEFNTQNLPEPWSGQEKKICN